MNPVIVTGQVNEQHMLSALAPTSVPPGPVTILIVPSTAPDNVDSDWMNGVSLAWADELNDVRQDIYTLSDGEPVDGA